MLLHLLRLLVQRDGLADMLCKHWAHSCSLATSGTSVSSLSSVARCLHSGQTLACAHNISRFCGAFCCCANNSVASAMVFCGANGRSQRLQRCRWNVARV